MIINLNVFKSLHLTSFTSAWTAGMLSSISTLSVYGLYRTWNGFGIVDAQVLKIIYKI